MTKQLHLYLSILFLILALGCTQTLPTNSFEIGKSFTISQNETLFNKEANLTIKTISFTSSLCPADVMCFWAGELGVNLQVNNETVYLGTLTKKNVTVSSYQIELLSIDYETKQATLKVS